MAAAPCRPAEDGNVQYSLKIIVVGQYGAQYAVHLLVPLVLVQHVVGIVALQYWNRDYHIPRVLPVGPAHHPSYALYDVDGGVSRLHERHRVERRHVDPLLKAPGVGEYPYFVRVIVAGPQPVYPHAAVSRTGGPVDMPRQRLVARQPAVGPQQPVGDHVKAEHLLGGGIQFERFLGLVHVHAVPGEYLGFLYGVVEHHHALQRSGLLVVAVRVCDGLADAADLCHVPKVYVAVVLDGAVLLPRGPDKFAVQFPLVNLAYHYVVSGEKPPVDGLGELQAVEDLAVFLGVVHRVHLQSFVCRVAPPLSCIHAGGGRHVQALSGRHARVAVRLQIVRLLDARGAGGAVGLVKQYQVKPAAFVVLSQRLGYPLHRVVRGEHDAHAAALLHPRQFACDVLHFSGRLYGNLGYRPLLVACCGLVRAHRCVLVFYGAVVGPLPHRLRYE